MGFHQCAEAGQMAGALIIGVVAQSKERKTRSIVSELAFGLISRISYQSVNIGGFQNVNARARLTVAQRCRL